MNINTGVYVTITIFICIGGFCLGMLASFIYYKRKSRDEEIESKILPLSKSPSAELNVVSPTDDNIPEEYFEACQICIENSNAELLNFDKERVNANFCEFPVDFKGKHSLGKVLTKHRIPAKDCHSYKLRITLYTDQPDSDICEISESLIAFSAKRIYICSLETNENPFLTVKSIAGDIERCEKKPSDILFKGLVNRGISLRKNLVASILITLSYRKRY